MFDFAAASLLTTGGTTTEKWTAIGQAPPIFWIILGAVVVGLLGFIVWTSRSNKVPHSIGPGVLAGVVGLLVVWTFVLYLVPALTAAAVTPTERTWDWTVGETLEDPGGSGMVGDPARGFAVYKAHACVTCHTMYVRPQDLGTGWAEGVDGNDIAEAADYVNMTDPPLGTQRNGPDLTFIGRRIPDMTYQIDHLVDPRRFAPDSVMPTYRHLSDEDLRDLAAFLVTLGNPKEALLDGSIGAAPPADDLSEAARYGADLYRAEGCVGCHSVDGSVNAGPTWAGLWGTERPLDDGTTVFVDAEYIRESIVDPMAKIAEGFPPIMPSYADLGDEEIEALIAYIESLAD